MLTTLGRRPTSTAMTHGEADALAARLLGTIRTRLGGLHIDHARRVAATAVDPDDDPRVTIVALLHDVLEKVRITRDELRELVQDDWICDAIDVLTTTADEPEHEYLARCAADPVALKIKRRDLADKLESGDVRVAPALASQLQAEARAKLCALERLAASTCRGVGPGHPVGSDRGDRPQQGGKR